MQYSKNQRDSARQANLADYFRRNGYDCEPPLESGEVHVHGFHGLWVNENTNQWFWFSKQKGGADPIDCVAEVLFHSDKSIAINELSTEAYQRNTSNYSQKPQVKQATVTRTETNNAVKFPVVYQKTFAYAQEQGETKEFMASHKLNMSCQSDLSRTAPLYDRSNGNYQSFLNEMSEKYGAERVAFILSVNVIQRQNADINSGWNYNFSQEAIDISKQFTFPEKRFTDNYFLGNTIGNLDSKVLDEMLCDFGKTLQQQNKKHDTQLELPVNEHEKKRVFAYLIKERKIDAKLVQELVEKKLLYQGSVKYKDKDGNEQFAKGNAVFVRKDMDGNIVGAEIHGTNTFKSFKKIAGSGNENLFQYAIGTPNKVYAFESAIDLLSFKMLADPQKIKDSLLVSMGGLKPNALKKFEANGLKIYSCVDNDESGRKFNEVNGFKSAGRKLSEEGVKDWNELLKKRVQELSKNIEAPAETLRKKVEAPTEGAEKKKPIHKSPRR